MSTRPEFDAILAAIGSQHELQTALSRVARTLQNRNDFPTHLNAMTRDQELTELLDLLEECVKTALNTQADAGFTSISQGETDLRALTQSSSPDEHDPSSTLIQSLAIMLLHNYTDGIDRYVETLEDYTLAREFSLDVDGDGLIDLRDSRIELLSHALRIDTDICLYLHQFLRRYFSGNFVQLPTLLGEALSQRHEVRARIDPLRRGLMADYKDIIEEDHWFGPKFDTRILECTDGDEVRTVHRTDEASSSASLLGISYPVFQTDFRTSMLDKRLRQFSIEEYAPLTTRCGDTPPGLGRKHHIQKFAHFVYDQEDGTFEHLDCSIRVHGIEEYAALFSELQRGRDPGRRTGRRFKLFKIRGRLEPSLIRDFLYEYFRYNLHLIEYFGNLTAQEAFAHIRTA